MTRFTLSDLRGVKRSMKTRLAVYMLALGGILVAALIAALLLLGQLKNPREELSDRLSFQMEAFASDMGALWRNVSVMGVHLSGDLAALLAAQGADLSALDGDPDALEQLEGALLEPLCQYTRQADCSGAFVVLNASLTGGDGARSGLYVQRGNAAHTTSSLLLYRGMADVGRRQDVMPHRKWAQEFDLAEFPGLTDHLATAAAPIERNCRTTPLLTLPDTSERAILLTVPVLGADGTVYGLCGFAVNQTYFSAHHVQPSGLRQFACVLSDPAPEGLDVSRGLLTYPAGGFCFVPDELFSAKPIRDGLSVFRGTDLAFVGRSQPFPAASGDRRPHTLTVLIPKHDYDRLLLKSRLETGGLLTLLLFFGVGCCLYYTRRYLRPVLRDIELLKAENCGGAQMTFDELHPVSAKLRFHEQTITDLESEKQALRAQVEGAQERLAASQEEVSRLAYLRKKEMDPAVYDAFLEGYALLTDRELAVCEALVNGLSARQCAEQAGTAVSTVETHRKNIYKKTKLHSVKHLQTCYALMRLEQQAQNDP